VAHHIKEKPALNSADWDAVDSSLATKLHPFIPIGLEMAEVWSGVMLRPHHRRRVYRNYGPVASAERVDYYDADNNHPHHSHVRRPSVGEQHVNSAHPCV